MLDALSRTKGVLRGIVALDPPALTEAEVGRLHALGVRGVRISSVVKVGPTFGNRSRRRAHRRRGLAYRDVPPRANGAGLVLDMRSRIEKLRPTRSTMVPLRRGKALKYSDFKASRR